MNYQAPQIEWQEPKNNEVIYDNNYQNDVICFWHNPINSYFIRKNPDEKSPKPFIVAYGGRELKEIASVADAKEWVEQTHYPSALAKAGFKPASEPLSDTLKWFELAVPEPTLKSQMVQIGCHFEEVAEMMTELGNRYESLEVDNLADCYKNMFTDSEHIEPLSLEKDIELLDSLCDQIVTALGVGYMFGFNMKSALAEVVRSNFSKFENGKPVFDNNGKIKKGANYTPPQLQEFV